MKQQHHRSCTGAVPPAVRLHASEVLSPHILLEVAKHLSKFALQNCRIVCKQWREAFLLAVHEVSLRTDKSLRHTLRHVQHMFPRLHTVHSHYHDNSSTRKMMKAMGGQRALKTINMPGSEDGHVTAAALPVSVEVLQIDTFRWLARDFQTLAPLTCLTSLSLLRFYPANSSSPETAVQQLVTALTALSKLQHLTLNLYARRSELWECTMVVVNGCLPSLPVLRQLTISSALDTLEVLSEDWDSLVGAVRTGASPNLQQVKLVGPRGWKAGAGRRIPEVEVNVSGTATVRKMLMQVHAWQADTVERIADYQVPDAPELVINPVSMILDCIICDSSLSMALDVDMQQLARMRKLVLCLKGNIQDSQQLNVVISNATQLEQLNLRNKRHIRASLSWAGSWILQCPNLTHLSLDDCKTDLQQLTGLTHLTYLRYAHQPARTHINKLRPQWLPPSLKRLSVIGCHVLSCLPRQQPCLTNLEELRMRSCYMSDSSAVESFSSASQSLESVSLEEVNAGCSLGDILTAVAATFPQLGSLKVSYDVSYDNHPPRLPADSTISFLRAATRLKHLRTLRLPTAVFTKEAIQLYTAMTQLQDILLDITVADASQVMALLNKLTGMPWLRHVDINCTQISDHQADSLTRAFEEAWPARHVRPDVMVLGNMDTESSDSMDEDEAGTDSLIDDHGSDEDEDGGDDGGGDDDDSDSDDGYDVDESDDSYNHASDDGSVGVDFNQQ